MEQLNFRIALMIHLVNSSPHSLRKDGSSLSREQFEMNLAARGARTTNLRLHQEGPGQTRAQETSFQCKTEDLTHYSSAACREAEGAGCFYRRLVFAAVCPVNSSSSRLLFRASL